jgi:glucose-6-phosphate isomerase
MNTEAKRRPIKQKVQGMVTVMIAGALLITNLIAVFAMSHIRSTTEKALIADMELNLSNVVASKSDLATSELKSYKNTVEEFAAYLTQIEENPEQYVSRDIPEVSAKNKESWFSSLPLPLRK